jgi:NAD(P) transhydrogenase subunit alpha
MYAKNLLNLLIYISKDGVVGLDLENEIVKGALITHNGNVVHQRIKELLK